MSDFFAVNGTVQPAAEAKVSVLDLGFLRGVGAFETMPTYGGHPHALPQHLARIWQSAAAFGVQPFFGEADLRRVIADIRARSGHAELRVNLVVTPGENTHGVFGHGTPTWVVIARDIHAPPPETYTRGVSAITFEAARHLPALKTTNYLCGKTGLELAEKAGAHEALYVSPEGYVSEGVTSNVLVVQGRRVMTPAHDCLPGITKAGIRPICAAQGLEWYECRLTRDDLYTADEVWVTSAVREVVPVVCVDGRSIADGRVGHWARDVRDAYRRQCVAEALADAQRAGFA
jgi:branched-subunit amino acid aminotransferase/4-amino-4-deoxychorismate lyase